MTLRTRLLLGYGYLVTLLVATALIAALGLQRLGGGVRHVLDENVASMRAAATVLESLERENRATIDLLLGRQEARAILVDAEGDCERAIALAATRAFAPGEPELVAALADHALALHAARARLLDLPRAGGLLGAYEREVAVPYAKVRADAQRLLDMNQEAVETRSTAAREESQAGAVGLASLVVLAVLSFGFLSRGLQEGVLARLTELQDVCAASALGDPRRRLRVQNDELGVVARALNTAFDRQAALQGQMDGRLSHASQLLLALLARAPAPAAILALDGEIIASTLRSRDDARLGALAADVRRLDRGAPVVEAGGRNRATVRDADGAYALELLVAGRTRPVGWLASAAATEAASGPAVAAAPGPSPSAG